MSEKFLLCFLVCLLFSSANSIDTITQNTPLRDGEVLVSQRQNFALGFFSPTNSTANRYVGIWYNNVSIQTVVWILNRDDPINGTSGILSMTENGNLALFNQNLDRRIWSTNISDVEVSNTSSAQLLDTGNFVFYNDSTSNFVAWQGFDHPTHTMLPDMKLGLDRRTGVNRFLTSWRSAVDPGTGDFTFSMDFTGSPQVFLYRGSTPLWRTGPWNGIRWNGIAHMGRFIFETTFTNNDNEVTVDYIMTSNSVFSMLTVNDSGVVQRQTWFEDQSYWSRFWYVPRDVCENYGICGVFGSCDPSNNIGFQCACLPGYEPRSAREWQLRDASDGCVRKRSVQGCVNGDGFVRVEGVRLPDTSASRATRVDPSMGMDACEEFCLSNCTCVGYTSNDISRGGSGSGCVSWHGELWDVSLMPNGDQDLYIRVDSIELALYARNAKRSKFRRIVAIIVPLIATSVIFLCLAYWFLRRKRRVEMEQSGKYLFSSSVIASPVSDGANESARTADLPFYTLNSVVAATNNFSFINKLGEGGFGSVYKGQLPNGQEVAIKRLSDNSGQGTEEFKNEVTLIAKLQHRNLVRLLGYCVARDEKMLIYEYMPNRGLDTFIFGKEKGPLVDWKKRFEITLGICRGMLYLHQDSRLRIIHRDLKASNVLLDSSMIPKISDFGMARIFRGEQMEATTKRVVGTYGYMSPEYAMEGLFSIKSDVFSFGVLLLEIISGRKNSSFHDETTVNLIGHVWDLWREDRAMEIVDSSLEKPYDENEVKRCIHVGLLCVQELATDRPSMSEVAFVLSRDTNLPSPKQPAFIFRGGHESSSVSVDGFSGYDDTITTVIGR